MLNNILISMCLLLSNCALAELQVGVGTHLNSYIGNVSEYTDIVKNYGFNSIRDGFSWNASLDESGEIKVTGKIIKTDLLFSKVIPDSESMSLLFVLGYGSNYYTNGDYPQNKGEVDKFVDYVGWVANKYKGKVKYYEVWNEWLLGTGIGSVKNRPNDAIFMYLVQQSYKKIKEIDPNAIILAGAINPLHENEVLWLRDLINEGLMNYVDGVSIHPYSFNEPARVRKPEDSIAAIDKFSSYISSSVGQRIPLYITEMGYPTGTEFKGGVSTAEAAQDIIKYTLLAASHSYIKGLWWYDLIDDGKNSRDKEDNFGLLYTTQENKDSALLLKALLPIIKNNKVKTTIDNDGVYHAILSDGKIISWHPGVNYSLQDWLAKLKG